MRRYLSGELELEFNPQGTLAERMRAGGAGIPGFHTPDRRRHRHRRRQAGDGFRRQGIHPERGIVADLSIVKAWKADATGNAIFRKTARNFNVPAANAAKVCRAGGRGIVPVGNLDPDAIHLPGIYVHRLVQGPHEKRIEQRTARKREEA